MSCCYLLKGPTHARQSIKLRHGGLGITVHVGLYPVLDLDTRYSALPKTMLPCKTFAEEVAYTLKSECLQLVPP